MRLAKRVFAAEIGRSGGSLLASKRVGAVFLLGLALAPISAQAPSPSIPPATQAAPSYASLAAELRALPASADFGPRLEAAAATLSPRDAARLLAEFAPKAGGLEARRAASRKAGELYLLLGSFLEAGRGFEAAGLLEPRDELLLLKASRSYLAAGEGGRAGELAALVLSSGKDPRLGAKARLAAAWAALLGGSPASAKALAATLIQGAEAKAGPGQEAAKGGDSADPEAPALAREARFLLWAASSGEERKAQALLLGSEHPGSPEALIAGAKPGAALLPLPHWYLGGLVGRAPEARPIAESLAPQPPASQAGPAAGPTGPQAPGSGGGKAEESAEPRYFQLGIFSLRANAEALAAELGKKGFGARLESRKVSGKELLAVLVEAGRDPAATGARLKDAGYEAYPLY